MDGGDGFWFPVGVGGWKERESGLVGLVGREVGLKEGLGGHGGGV